MIIKITKHLDVLPQPEATEVTTMETPSTAQLPTTQSSREAEADNNHSSNAAETHPPSDTFETSPTPQTSSSSAVDTHRNSLISIILTVMLIFII